MMKAIQSLNLSENVYVSKKNGIPSNFPTDENDIIIPSPGDPIKLLFALSRELGKNENMRKTCIGVEKNISTKITESQTIRIPIRKS